MKNNPQTKEDIFWSFTDFQQVKVQRSKVQLTPLHGNFIKGVANPEIVYMLLYYFKYFVLTDFLKKYCLKVH